ncbi:hypothetical protein V6N13_108045 [Hibiscus sabdariffa]|uniref:Pentatricopeptide repeat-containing protein n=1 Tax=Hibiscus sabdariffa TaxID=183260 RepID=A0ABR2SR70_9ROSI
MMVNKRGVNKTVSDQAIHLDLVAKAQGIPGAENYFVDLPESSKNNLTYGALLNCYCKELMTGKAEALIEKMKELNLPLDSYTYNVWMRTLAAVNDISGVERVIEEMKRDAEDTDDWTTYSNIASIYATF